MQIHFSNSNANSKHYLKFNYSLIILPFIEANGGRKVSCVNPAKHVIVIAKFPEIEGISTLVSIVTGKIRITDDIEENKT